ncbi:bifunctional DNA primase/polymerase [Fodinicola acaciae]|uniref:bifunctional DNA primase/polymerase n=1 Tax=Fodinicola acaciae TaxID=2681555 RepID=UPI001C9E52EB|nr:bifunctional DNA primase/polymerase [Fodinicola acaciae]
MITPLDLTVAGWELAARGWPVFMLGRSKRPVANCPDCRPGATDGHDPEHCDCLTCHGFYAATVNPATIAAIVRAVPGGQLAVRTGTRAGLVVVDVDPAHGGMASLTRLIDTGLATPTARVITGTGGHHLYYRHPGQPVLSRPLPGYPGIDIKADGGYVVAPPSTNRRTGRSYTWVTDGRAVEEMPPPLISACLSQQRPEPTLNAASDVAVRTVAAGGISYPGRLLDSHLDAVRRAPVGKRRTTLYGAARGVARMVAAGAISHTDAVAALTKVGREVEQSEREICAAIAGGFRDETAAA